MKRGILTTIATLALAAAMPASAATNDITALVQKGLFEEEANHNLDAAVLSYQSAINSYDSDRQLAATAVFRLGECYRKLGRTNEASAEYDRVIRDFGDQPKLVELARSYVSNAQSPTPPNLAGVQNPDEQKQLAATEQMIKTSPDLINASGGAAGPETPLESAADAGHLSVARLLLDNGADPNLMGGDGRLPLCVAAFGGHKEMVEFLLERGADVNARSRDGKSALDDAAEEGFEAVARVLLERHADPNSALSAACVAGQDKMAQFLLAHGAAINGANNYGETPLIAAINANRPAAVALLLKSGADPNGRATNGITPLGESLGRGSFQMVDLLLTNGADPNAEFSASAGPHNETHRMTPLIKAVGGMYPTPFGVQPSGEPVRLGPVPALLAHGANPNLGDDEGRTPLDYAIILDKGAPVANALIAAGANVNALDKNDDPPLALVDHLPVGPPQDEARRLLLGAGASENYLRLKGVYWTRKGSGSIGQNVQPKSKDNQPPTAVELIARIYAGEQFLAVAFPDLAHITLDRLRNGVNQTTNLDVTPALASADCAAIPALEWGDVLEVPEKDHRLGDVWSGFSENEISNIVRCVKRTVLLRINNQSNQLTLLPEIAQHHLTGGGGFGGWMTVGIPTGRRFPRLPPGLADTSVRPESTLYTFDLSQVVHDSGLLLLSSDLRRVQLRRGDGKVLTFNLAASPPPAFTLQQGDEIEVPEKKP